MRIIFSSVSWAEYIDWQDSDCAVSRRINDLINDVRRHPFVGMGKPEPLRNEMSVWWWRRITAEHRLVYRVAGKGETQAVEIASRRYHYDRR